MHTINDMQLRIWQLSSQLAQYDGDDTYTDNGNNIDQAVNNYFNDNFQKYADKRIQDIHDCEGNINALKNRAVQIKTAEKEAPLKTFGEKTGRFFRSVGIIAATIVSIVTIIPAITLVFSAGDKIANIFDRYLTLKSQDQLDAEKEWERLKTSTKEKALHNPLKDRVRINTKESLTLVDIHDHLKLTNQPNLDTEVAALDKRIKDINEKLNEDLF